MSALPVVSDWRRCVAGLLPSLHLAQVKAPADLSLARAAAGRCQAGRIAPHAPTDATPASARRRFERLLANPRLPPGRAQRDLARSLPRPWAGRTALLILDETPKANDPRAVCVRAAYAGRALPLASACYPPHRPPEPMPRLVPGLPRLARGAIPPGCRVVLLADRGPARPVLIDFCRASGRHHVPRLQGQTRVRLPGGTEHPAAELAPRPGARRLGKAEAFKKAGWRGANVVATWERGMKEPWLLPADEPAGLRHRRAYAKRMWVEESSRDDKSSGFGWQDGRVNDPSHAGRLLLLVALATVPAAGLGGWAVKAGRRRRQDARRGRGRCRRPGVVQMGLRWLRDALAHGLYELLKFGRLYLYPK
jgi:hypothetical protein